MLVSVVIRSRDEADRLRLTLASLARQTQAAEIVVVNDASVDHTAAVLAEAAEFLSLRIVTHETAQGRSAASNAGARAASGEILLFLDGDTLAGPDLVARHAAVHTAQPRRIARGETFHLRCTRLLQNPDTAAPRPGEEARLARLSPEEIARLKVTRQQVTEDFAAVERRAEPGVYPGAGPRLLYELEMDALRHHPDCSVLWAAASGSNFSVERERFLRVGGFFPPLDINEHRELALRLCQDGGRMAAADGARSYHLTHRSGWRDPLQDTAWEKIFFAAHPLPEVKLLPVLWASLLPQGGGISPAERIASLPELERAARRGQGLAGAA